MILLRPSTDFSVNGALRGGIIAYDESGEPLGWEARGNWSDRQFLAKQAADLAETVAITEDHARTLLTKAMRDARKAGDAADAQRQSAAAAPHPLPVVDVSNRHLRDVAADGWNLIGDDLIPDHERLYGLGDAVVDLAERKGHLKPRALGRESLRWHIERLGDWMREGQAGPYPVAPPREVLEDMLAHPKPPILPLTGMAYSPIVTPDGEILIENGYHAASGYYVALGNLQVPPVPLSPTQDDVANAKRLLTDELLVDFKFAHAADRVHAVEAIMAPIIRPLIQGPTPLRMIEAPTPGSGKGLLAEAVAEIAIGGPPRSMTEGHDDDEWRKRLTAAALDAQPVTVIDNVRRRLESGSLASMLTVTEWSDRLLGASRTVTIPIRTSWYATGNNPAYSEEIGRRVVRIRLDTGEERPWERTGFRHDPLLAWVRKDRDLLIWAVLVLVRAWIAAGRPRASYVMGSYDEWAAISGGILDNAGLPGLLGNREETYRQAEAEIEAWRELIGAWWQAYQAHRIGVDKLFDLARDHKLLTEIRTGRTDRGARTAMGSWLASMTDRVVAGYRIRRDGETETRGAAYRLENPPARDNAGKPGLPNAEVLKGSEGSAKPLENPEPGEPSEPQRYLAPQQGALITQGSDASVEARMEKIRADLDTVYPRAPEASR